MFDWSIVDADKSIAAAILLMIIGELVDGLLMIGELVNGIFVGYVVWAGSSSGGVCGSTVGGSGEI